MDKYPSEHLAALLPDGTHVEDYFKALRETTESLKRFTDRQLYDELRLRRGNHSYLAEEAHRRARFDPKG